jgi:endoglycosylceramidase
MPSAGRSQGTHVSHLVVVAALATVCMVAPTAAAQARKTPAPHPLPRLHAVRGASPAIVTRDGRQVLLRGVNVNQLGDYFQQNPGLKPTLPLRRSDFTGIRGLGMNVVRLIVHWSALEPKRGELDTAYVARIRRAVRWAKSRGIYVVLDMHQDAWGKYIASPKSEVCAPGAQHQHGWDGAPQWATITNGTPTCFTGLREVAPAVANAFQSFYDDTNGIQTRLVQTWARLAKAFAADPTVAGYDLLNEPNPGLTYPYSDSQSLAEFYARVIPAIRTAEKSAKGGFSHIAFFEPGAIWSALGTDQPPNPSPITDPNVVFAPHLYGGSLAIASIDDGYNNAESTAAQYGATVWSGEWGWFSSDPKTDEPNIRAYAAQEDAHLWGGAWWDWKQACGDPHMFSDGDDMTPEPVSVSLNRFECPSGRALGIPPTTRRILARPYVRFAPGRLASLKSDPSKRTAAVAGKDASRRGSCRLELWVPGAARPRYRGTHVKRLRVHRARGGWDVTACVHGSYKLAPAG